MANVLASYTENEILTAEPEKLVLLMYQGAIKFIRQARLAVEEKRIEDAHNAILRAYAIVAELMATLDKDKGGDVAIGLERSYDFILYHLRQADATKSEKYLIDVENLLVPLAETWKDAFFKNRSKPERELSSPDSYKPVSAASYPGASGVPDNGGNSGSRVGDDSGNGRGSGLEKEKAREREPETARKPGTFDVKG